MANNISNAVPIMVSRGLAVLREHIATARNVNTDFTDEVAAAGDTINMTVPSSLTAAPVVPSAVPPTPQDSTPGKVTINLNRWEETNFHLTDKESAEIDPNSRFIQLQTDEAVRALGNQINKSILDEHTGVFGFVGTAGTTPFASDVTDLNALDRVLGEQRAPLGNRRLIMDFAATEAAKNLSQLTSSEIVGTPEVPLTGFMGARYGFDLFTDAQIPTHTAGTLMGTPIAKAATAQAVGLKAIVVDTGVAGAVALLKGDIITFVGQTQTYVVTADATEAIASTDVTVNIEPGLVVALAGSEAISVKSTHVVNLGFHRDAFALAMRPLGTGNVRTNANIVSEVTDPETGVSLRLSVVQAWKQTIFSFDALWGAKLVRPELAVRLAG